MLFGEEDDTYIYQPYLYDFTFGYLILSYMTNFKTTGDNDDIWDLVIGSSLVDTIISHIPNKFIDMLKKGFDEAIEFKKTKIYSFERKMLFEMKEQIQEYIDTIQLFTDRVPEVFGDNALEKLKELGNMEEPEVAMKVLESKVKKTGKNGKR